MTAFTRIGTTLWHWEPWMALGDREKLLWLALYTSADAKRWIPGLFYGSVSSLAEVMHISTTEVHTSLTALIDHKLVEHDRKNRIVRFLKLPDCGEWPSGLYILQSWWKRFQDIPACPTRDAHVIMLRWLLDRGAATSEKNKSKKPTAHHEEVWAETFATILVPLASRDLNTVPDSDTSTEVQPSLFRSAPATPHGPSTESTSTHSGASSSDSDQYPIKSGLPIPTPLPTPGGYSGGYGEGEGEGEGAFFSSSSGSGSGTGGSGGGTPGRPRLTLVPPVGYTVDQYLDTLSTSGMGRYPPVARHGLQFALSATIAALVDQGVGLADVAVAGSWIARETVGIGSVGGDPRSLLSVWAADPGNVLAALAAAREHERLLAERCALAAEARSTLGIPT